MLQQLHKLLEVDHAHMLDAITVLIATASSKIYLPPTKAFLRIKEGLSRASSKALENNFVNTFKNMQRQVNSH